MVGIISLTPCGEEVIVEWSIESFFTLLEEDYTSGCSEDFSFGGEKWYFTYYLNGRNECDSSGHLDIHLVKYSSDRCCYKQEFSLSLKTLNGEKYNETHGIKIFRGFDNYKFLRFIPASELSSTQSELLPDGILTLVWVMKNTTPAKSDNYNCREKLQTVVNIAVFIMAIVTGLGFAYSKLSPLQPPEEFLLPQPILMVTDIGSTYLEIVWVLPEESKMNTKPARYIAYFRKYRDQWQEVSFPNASQTSYCLINLDPGVPYQIYVVAIDSSGFSRSSEIATFRTSKKAIAIEKLLHDMKEIMVSGKYSDITVSVRGEKFRLHRSILGARNPFFSSRLNNESQEPTPGTLSIDDCDPDQFRTLVHYIYTGSADNLSPENVCGLYEVAVAYQEQQMKTECLEFIMNTLSVDNFCDYTALALKHEEKELFQKAAELFMRKVKEIICQVKWEKFLEKYPVQANELYIKAMDQNCKNLIISKLYIN